MRSRSWSGGGEIILVNPTNINSCSITIGDSSVNNQNTTFTANLITYTANNGINGTIGEYDSVSNAGGNGGGSNGGLGGGRDSGGNPLPGTNGIDGGGGGGGSGASYVANSGGGGGGGAGYGSSGTYGPGGTMGGTGSVPTNIPSNIDLIMHTLLGNGGNGGHPSATVQPGQPGSNGSYGGGGGGSGNYNISTISNGGIGYCIITFTYP